jgi:hypothetical protein
MLSLSAVAASLLPSLDEAILRHLFLSRKIPIFLLWGFGYHFAMPHKTHPGRMRFVSG